MRLGYTDKYGVKQVAEVVKSSYIEDVSVFYISGGMTSVPMGMGIWMDKDIKDVYNECALERCVMFEAMSKDKHEQIVEELVRSGFCFVEDVYLGEEELMSWMC